MVERERRKKLAAWVANEILPHEPKIRFWLRRNRTTPEDVDDVIQEAYCRIAMLEAVDDIDRPEAYFFSICRNLLLRRLKRERIVPITTIAEIESVALADGHPSPEREAAGRIDFGKLMRLMNRLPERCRAIVRLRKVEGWSQREIAQHFTITEKAVEKQIWLGVKAIRAAWDEAEADAERNLQAFGASKDRRV